MSFNSKICRVFDAVECRGEEKLITVSYEFPNYNFSQIWIFQSHWKDIESALGQYVSDKKHLVKGHTETLYVPFDIQLEVKNVRCPSHMNKIFNSSATVAIIPTPTYHNIQLMVIVRSGDLWRTIRSSEIDKAVKKLQNGSVFSPLHSSSSAENQPGPSKPKAESTPLPRNSSELLFLEDFEKTIPKNDIHVAKRKRQEQQNTPDIFEYISDTDDEASPTTRARSAEKAGPSSTKKKSNVLANVVDPDTDSDDNEPKRKTPSRNLNDWVIRHRGKTYERDRKKLQIISPPRMTKKATATKPTTKRKPGPKSRKNRSMTPDSSDISARLANLSPRKTCNHMSIDQMKEHFAPIEEEMNNAVRLYEMSGYRVPDMKYMNFSRYTDILTDDQIAKAMSFLSNHYESFFEVPISESLKMAVLSQYVLPQWSIYLFTKEYKMTRKEAVEYLLRRDELETGCGI